MILAFVGVGLAVVIWAVTERGVARVSDDFLLWAALAVALTAASGVVFELGVRGFRELAVRSGPPIPGGKVALQTIGLLGLMSAGILATLLAPSAGATARGVLLCMAAILGGSFTAVRSSRFATSCSIATERPRPAGRWRSTCSCAS